MSEPFSFLSTHTIKEGKLEATKAWTRRFIELIAANEPRLIAAHLYLNESETEVSIILIQADADAMDLHLQVAGEMISEGHELAETVSIKTYGDPGPVLRQVLSHSAEAGIPVCSKPHHLGGVTRSAAA